MKQGKVSENIIKRSVLKYIDKDINGAGTDCAIFSGFIADETDALCGAFAVYRAVNNAVSAGYIPQMLSLSVVMPESMREIKLKNIIISANEAAKLAGIAITDGHTESLDGINAPIITATLLAKKDESWAQQALKAGDAIIMTNWMAMSGAARLARKYRDRITEKYPEFIVNDAIALEQFYSLIPEAAVAMRSGAKYMNDCSDGGIFAALWQLGDINGVGLEVNLRDIPVFQESIEVCEYFDINPYKIRSDGSLLIVTDRPDEMMDALTKENIKSTLIGHITDGIDRVIISGEERRFLEEPRQDEGVML